MRSPAIFKFLPLKGTSIGAMFEAGNCAALTRNLLLSAISSFDELMGIASSGKNNSHSNKLGRAPPRPFYP